MAVLDTLLKERHLRKHHIEVDTFFAEVSHTVYESEVSKQYQVRFEKNRNTLFTFLDYDNVSWNNTYAEHAIKLLATHRNKNIDFFRASRIEEYLRIMSIYQTCQYKRTFGSFFQKWTFDLPIHGAASRRHVFETNTNRFTLVPQIHPTKSVDHLRQEASISQR